MVSRIIEFSDTASSSFKSEKSYTQKAGDAMSGNSNENSVSFREDCQLQGRPLILLQQSMSDKAKNAMGMDD